MSAIRLYLETDTCPSLISVSNSGFSYSESNATKVVMCKTFMRRKQPHLRSQQFFSFCGK